MIGRRQPQDTADEVLTVPAVEKRPMHDAECFKPSSFASRKAEAERHKAQTAANDQQLVSMGRTSHWMKDRRGKDVYVDGELFFEKRHPSRRYVRLDGDATFYPLFDDTRRDSKPEPIGTFSRRSVLPSRYQPAGETQVRPV